MVAGPNALTHLKSQSNYRPNSISRKLSRSCARNFTETACLSSNKIDPAPDCAIFADTQWEPRAVYQHFAWLRSPGVLPFPVYIVTAGNRHCQLNVPASKASPIPFARSRGCDRVSPLVRRLGSAIGSVERE